MKLNLSLRLKVTIINTLILIVCSLLLTISTTFLATKSIDLVALPITQSAESKIEGNVNIGLNNGIQPAEITTQAAQLEKQKLIISSGTYMVGVILLGSIATYFTTNKSLESLKKLNNEIKEISEHNLSKIIDDEESDEEIRGIIKSFNKMLNRINEAFESQKQFSSNVAHELRTPLAVIQMKIDVFKKRKEKTSEDYEKLMSVVEKNNNRLSKVVDELLSISNNYDIEYKDKIDFTKIIESVVNELEEISDKRKIKINIYENMYSKKNKKLMGNEQLLYRALYNVVENAIKYNFENGYVNLYINKYDDFISISIRNSGIEINENDYENIFKPFYRVDKSRSRNMGGAGLGLSIVKQIINQHNGEININSDNKETEFIIQIPYN